MKPGATFAGVNFARLVRFGSVGIAATLLYAAVAWSLTAGARIGAAPASVLAYGLAGMFSYLGHKRFTFRSSAAHAAEAPKFIVASMLGAGVATAAPLVLTDRLGLPPIVAIAFACVVIPLMNYLILDLLVFARRSAAGRP
jgi:putative flippase GtrA